MGNREKLSQLIREHIEENRQDFPVSGDGWIISNTDANVYHNIFSRVFLDLQNEYEEIRDLFKATGVINGYESNFEIVNIRISNILGQIFLRGIFHGFLDNQSVRVTMVISFRTLDKRSVSIRGSSDNEVSLFFYHTRSEGVKCLTYMGIYKFPDNVGTSDWQGLNDCYV